MNSPSADVESILKEATRRLRKQDYAGASELFKKALELDERRVDLHEGLATACFLSKDYSGAIEHFNRMTMLDPRQAKPHVNMGAVYNRMGDFNKAVNVLRRGIAKQRTSEGFYNLGIAHRGLNQLSMAISAYREAIRINPEVVEAHLNLANALVEMGNFQQAMIHYREVLQRDPDSQRAQKGLEHSEAAVTQAKQSISPFGRLVDAEQARGNSKLKTVRQLSDVERMEDRRQVLELTNDIKSAAGDLLEQIRDTMEPALNALNKAIAQSDESGAHIAKELDQYRNAVEECAELRRLLKRKLTELSKHEEQIANPNG